MGLRNLSKTPFKIQRNFSEIDDKKEIATNLKYSESIFTPKQNISKLKAFTMLGRYSNQTGTFLLFMPCVWGVCLASPDPLSLHAMSHYFLYFWGAFHLRSAGCAVNDICDRDFDKKVERTKIRPLAANILTVNEAMLFTATHCLLGLPVLFIINPYASYLALGVFPLAMLYPLAKRYTYYPQVVLGSVFNFGVFVGFTSIMGSYDMLTIAVPFYVAGILYTVIYDTIYAVQDKDDDVKAGVKGMALAWGDNIVPNSQITSALLHLFLIYGGY